MVLYHRVASKLIYSSRSIRDLRRGLTTYTKLNPVVIISEEIRAAVEGRNPDSPPVVALESAIYTHGTHDVSS